MSKKILLFALFLLLAAVVAVTVGVYQRYLTPNRLIPVVQSAIEDALGQPIDLQEARVAGIGTVPFGPTRIPAAEGPEPEEPWFRAASATVHLELGKLIARR